MKHIIRIKEGRIFTKISLKDDNNRKSRIWYNSDEFRRTRDQMGITRQMDKLRRLVNMYNDASDENDKVSSYNLKEDAYYRISTVAVLAIERAIKEGRLEKDTVKEALEELFEERKIRQEINKKKLDNLKFEFDETEVLKKMEETSEDQKEEQVGEKQDTEEQSENR